MEVYESHLGGIFFADGLLDWDELYCDECGDSDKHLGHADTWEEVKDMITDLEGWCPYEDEYMNDLRIEFENYMRRMI